MSAISMKEVASNMPDGRFKEDMSRRAEQTISWWLDELCPRPPIPPLVWPWPGPPPWVYSTVLELAVLAHSFQEGSLRKEILRVTGQLTQRAFEASDAGHMRQG
jgi:hypothetical protein